MASTPYRPPAHRGLSLLYLSEQLIVVDKPSGLLSVPGRGAKAQRELSILFQERKVRKRYQALATGTGRLLPRAKSSCPSVSI